MNFFEAPTMFNSLSGLIAMTDSLRASSAELEVALLSSPGKSPV